ncbi:PIG-L family deacetylase [Streptomyces sp. NBC_01216]|uniref:PIG-L deacetylase family protein n=1 Tax=unclassified Streptomyces TaxID=2593676 RepID=UPI002E0FF675|nr:PIG-L family deacetylase [Streptomyces sp. NBC_01216]
MAVDALTALSRCGVLLVLSPHPDDAVLSCGALLGELRDRSSVTVMTVFTEGAPPPYTLSARQFLRQTGAANAEELYMERRAEDRAVLAKLGVDRFHGGFVDGLFRRVAAQNRGRRLAARLLPELGHVYPTHRLHLSRGYLAPSDAKTVRQVTDTVRELLPGGRGLVLAPLGVGGHADHLLVRTAAERSGLPVVYYSDFPYNLRAAPDPDFVSGLAATEASWDRGLGAKAELIRGYRTQVNALFPDGTIPRVPEVYLLPGGVQAVPASPAAPAVPPVHPAGGVS